MSARCCFPFRALGLAVLGVAAATALPVGLSGPAAAQQIEGRFSGGAWDFTPRDRRVAIALAIKQVEDGLLGPDRSNTNVQNFICNGPSGDAGATANFFCEIANATGHGTVNSGNKGQANAGNQTATNNNSTNGNVNQSTQSNSRATVPAATSRVEGVAAALQGRH